LEGKINGKGNDDAGTEKLYPERRRLRAEG
jgi:hypothetical protein